MYWPACDCVRSSQQGVGRQRGTHRGHDDLIAKGRTTRKWLVFTNFSICFLLLNEVLVHFSPYTSVSVGQNRMSDPQELELQAVMNHCVSVGN